MKQSKVRHTSPHSFQIEITEGCCLECNFCGVWKIHQYRKSRHEQRFRYMSIPFAQKLSQAIKQWLGDTTRRHIEFELHGEPLLNPCVVDIISIFRKALPKSYLIITTNTLPILNKFESSVNALFKAGLNCLLCDAYGEFSGQIHTTILKYIQANPSVGYHDVFRENFNIFAGQHILRVQPSSLILFQDDLTRHPKVVTKPLHNQSGDVHPQKGAELGLCLPSSPLKKQCVYPFRQFCIHYDGVVSPCCAGDWMRQGAIGKFPEESLQTIWNGDLLNVTRALLRRGERKYLIPCKTCSYMGGHLQGFLADFFYGEKTSDLVALYGILRKQYRRHSYETNTSLQL